MKISLSRNELCNFRKNDYDKASLARVSPVLTDSRIPKNFSIEAKRAMSLFFVL
jgi:hypothetical protein